MWGRPTESRPVHVPGQRRAAVESHMIGDVCIATLCCKEANCQAPMKVLPYSSKA